MGPLKNFFNASTVTVVFLQTHARCPPVSTPLTFDTVMALTQRRHSKARTSNSRSRKSHPN